MNYKNEADDSWMVRTDGRYSTAIYNYLRDDGIPKEGARKIMSNAAKVLGYCPNPNSDVETKKTGIVIGKIQSGKTSNFIALTALAFDNNYSHVVVFGGTKNVLVKQNGDRIKEYFSKTPEVVVLNTQEHQSYLDSKTINQFIKTGKKVIIVTLKNARTINNIRDDIFDDGELSEMPTLMIDDEGDEASLNTLVKKGKKSAVYRSIESLKDLLKIHCFVSVTATPQANMLIDSMDILSPSFGLLTEPGEGYCGLDVFHTLDSQYVIPLPENEKSILDSLPESFMDALATYFVGCGIFMTRRETDQDKFSMLIHPSVKKIDHSSVKGKADTLIEEWQLLAEDPSDIAYSDLKNRLFKAYSNYKDSTVPTIPDFDVVEKNALEAIKTCKTHLVNGDSIPQNADDFFEFNIYVGGQMLGRGLTLKGLAVTYIIRTPKVPQVDTTSQQARWFGYKRKYLDLCRIYAPKAIIESFWNIREHENDLWSTIRDAHLQGVHFKDIARVFVLADRMKMTRSNVASTRSFVYTPWNIQRYISTVPEYAKSNETVLSNYKSKTEHLLEECVFGSEKAAPYHILPNRTFSEINTEIFQQFIFPNDSKLQRDILGKLGTLLCENGEEPLVDVIWMRDAENAFSRHNIKDNGRIDNYMVGRRPEDYSKPAVYLGDLYQFVSEDKMHLQIHRIKDKNSELVSPALALYIPESFLVKINNLVTRKLG